MKRELDITSPRKFNSSLKKSIFDSLEYMQEPMIKFIVARISKGVYNTKDYESTDYLSITCFKKGLKEYKCPFRVDKNGLFKDIEGSLSRREWNVDGIKYTASVSTI